MNKEKVIKRIKELEKLKEMSGEEVLEYIKLKRIMKNEKK